MGFFIRNEADVSVSPMRVLIPRLGSVEYTIVTFKAKILLIFRHPKSTYLRNIFLEPFEKTVWFIVALTLIVIAVLMFSIHLCLKDDKLLEGFSFSFVFAVGIFCLQGFHDNIRGFSTKAVITMSLFLSFILFQFYSAFIVSSLLTEPTKTIKTVRDFTKSNLKGGSEDLQYNRDYFEKSTDENVKMFYKMKIQQKTGLNYFDAKDGLKKIKEGDFGFNVDTSVAYKYLAENLNQREICELQEIWLFPISPVTCPLKKGSPFLEMFRNRFVSIWMIVLRDVTFLI